ncbi:hypothetical protein [Phyllobacterium zundukense]|uniref:Uncharacterized protein n=1 Tax=Phyllobacterium zundukense TaxID=1867719 RepID=A0A2N9VXW6_9HYPH|nr:hypothetical protein [Phyllobacterium zundukense]ATU95663.1 hypothetical protein BLM14_28495 [Phyllobacterium zundukense]PIO44334.1 hypothetical protein B5P45_13825 [Phyllobacterium zundukense]
MKHHALKQLQNVAEIDQSYPRQTMSRSERLERWAELLERNPDRRLSTLHQTEYQSAVNRAAMRSDGSPISVAFEDPVFRATGLENDSYGEAKRFFELTDEQLHKVICYCHFGSTVSAATAAYHIRKIHARRQGGLFAWLHEMFVG